MRAFCIVLFISLVLFLFFDCISYTNKQDKKTYHRKLFSSILCSNTFLYIYITFLLRRFFFSSVAMAVQSHNHHQELWLYLLFSLFYTPLLLISFSFIFFSIYIKYIYALYNVETMPCTFQPLIVYLFFFLPSGVSCLDHVWTSVLRQKYST